MTKKYFIQGMACNGCVARVKQSLEMLDEVEIADIQLASPQGSLQLKGSVSLQLLQKAVGPYKLEEVV